MNTTRSSRLKVNLLTTLEKITFTLILKTWGVFSWRRNAPSISGISASNTLAQPRPFPRYVKLCVTVCIVITTFPKSSPNFYSKASTRLSLMTSDPTLCAWLTSSWCLMSSRSIEWTGSLACLTPRWLGTITTSTIMIQRAIKLVQLKSQGSMIRYLTTKRRFWRTKIKCRSLS